MERPKFRSERLLPTLSSRNKPRVGKKNNETSPVLGLKAILDLGPEAPSYLGPRPPREFESDSGDTSRFGRPSFRLSACPFCAHEASRGFTSRPNCLSKQRLSLNRPFAARLLENDSGCSRVSSRIESGDSRARLTTGIDCLD